MERTWKFSFQSHWNWRKTGFQFTPFSIAVRKENYYLVIFNFSFQVFKGMFFGELNKKEESEREEI